MGSCQPKIYRKRQMLIKIQSDCNVIEPLSADDGKIRVEVGQDATPEVNMNERNIAMKYLSKLPNVAGAIIGKMAFTSEIVGSGSLTVPPEVDSALIACGHRRVNLTSLTMTAPPSLADVGRNSVIVGSVSGAVGRVVTPIDASVAKVFIEIVSGTFAVDDVVTLQGEVDTLFTVKATAVGGFTYMPISEDFQFATMRSEEDGIHKNMYNAVGTVSMSADASGIGKFEFKFTGVIDKRAVLCDAVVGGVGLIASGTYLYSSSESKIIMLVRDYDSTDTGLVQPYFINIEGEAVDTDVYETATSSLGFTLSSTPAFGFFCNGDMTDDIVLYTTVPPILQDSQTSWGEFEPVFNSVSFDVANDILARPNANDHKGLISAFITGRNPSGSIDPEMVGTDDYDFANAWFNNELNPLKFRFGQKEGNTCMVFLTSVQAQNNTDQERDGLASIGYEYGAKGTQDDEYEIVFV